MSRAGQGRVRQPRRQREGPPGGRDARRGRAPGPAQAGRHDRRADERQHRHRPRHGGGDSRLSLHPRDARQDVARKDRSVARLRRRRRHHADERRRRIRPNRTTASPTGWHPRYRARFSRISFTTTSIPRRTTIRPVRRSGSRPRGTITHFVAGIGTGGTISGTARYLKEKNPAIHVIGADPEGSIYSGDIPRSYAVEGIGMNYLPETVDLRVIDEMVRVSDRDSFLDGAAHHARGGLARRRLFRDRGRRRRQAGEDASRRTRSSSSFFPTRAAATCRRSSTTTG